MKIKRMKTAVLAAVMTAALAGCGSPEQSTDGQSTEAQNTEAQNTEAQNAETQNAEAAAKDSVVVVMTPNSEPEAGFDPAYGWGAGDMFMSR